jgi:hypothetical protein
MATAKKKGAATEAAPVAPRKEFKVLKKITLSFLKLDVDVTRYVRIDGPMHIGQDLKQKRGEKGEPGRAVMEPATICNVTDLETGEACNMIVSAVLKSVFEESYKDASYVGKGFALTKRAKKEGKRYFPIEVSEVEI